MEPHFATVEDQNLASSMYEESSRFSPSTCELETAETEDELHLAARLGQALLEQNHLLEERLQQLQATVENTTAENLCLREQLATIRMSRQAVEDERDRLEGAVNDLESQCATLCHQSGESNQRVEQLQHSVTQLNATCDEKQVEISDLKVRYESLLARWQACNEQAEQEFNDGLGIDQKRSSSVCLHCRVLSAELTDLMQQSQAAELLWNEEKDRLVSNLEEMMSERDSLLYQLASSRQEINDLGSAPVQVSVSTSVQSCEPEISSNGVSVVECERSCNLLGGDEPVMADINNMSSIFNEMYDRYEVLQCQFEDFRQHCTCQSGSSLQGDISNGPSSVVPLATEPCTHGQSKCQRSLSELSSMLYQLKAQLHNLKL